MTVAKAIASRVGKQRYVQGEPWSGRVDRGDRHPGFLAKMAMYCGRRPLCRHCASTRLATLPKRWDPVQFRCNGSRKTRELQHYAGVQFQPVSPWRVSLVCWNAALKAAARIPVGMAIRPIPAIEVTPPRILPRTVWG